MRNKDVLGFLTANKGLFTVTIFVLIILGILAPMQSFYFQKIIDSDSGEKLLWNVITGTLFCTIVFLFEWLSKNLQARTVKASSISLRDNLFKAIIAKNIMEFSQQNSAEYISRLTNDIKIIKDEIYNNIFVIITQAAFAVSASLYLIFINPLLFILVVILAIPPLALSFVAGKWLKPKKDHYVQGLSKYVELLKDFFSGFEVLKTFNISSIIISKHLGSSKSVETAECTSNKALYFVQTLSSFINNISFLIVMALSVFLAIQGKITIGLVVAVTQMLNYTILPCRIISQTISQIRSNDLVVKRLNEIIAEKKDKAESESPVALIDKLESKIDFEQVSLCLNGKEILENVSLTVKCGSKYAVVGESGSGKSIMMKALLHYFDDYKGEIRVDGLDNHNISAESLYKMCPLIHQNVFLFSDTIRNNITLYSEFTDNEVMTALDRAGLKPFVDRLEHGVNQYIDENGKNLSGGERQRISIARALIRNPSLIILDEATSSLDNVTAHEIEKNILDIPGLTPIVITHRYHRDLLGKYTCIFVMKAGKVIERGTFDELMDLKGYFYSLYSISVL